MNYIKARKAIERERGREKVTEGRTEQREDRKEGKVEMKKNETKLSEKDLKVKGKFTPLLSRVPRQKDLSEEEI
jgi:hypothetical protein